ncbi:MAG: radical SAM protein [Lachnospiraceae bacterium]|nr:radical SAM protein [Lachnospiraceae bacterium]
MQRDNIVTDNINWWGKPYYSLDAYFKNTYGQKIYKIAVDAGLSCPNRDGSLDSRGCIFCSAGGSGDFAVRFAAENNTLSVREQIETGISRFNKAVGNKFVIYFQAYTNTYGDIDYLRRIWSEALEYEDVVGISIATRPDCLGEDVIELLRELKEKYCVAKADSFSEKAEDSARGFCLEKFIWVELGLQSIHERTSDYIRRGYPLATYEEAVLKLGKLEIPYITHIIFGLPGETKDEMLETVFYVEQGIFDYDKHSQIKPFGMKLQLLHVLKGTDLATDYEAGLFKTMEMDEYIDLVIEALQKINPNIVIHRVTGDGPKTLLVSPTWSGNKKLVLNTLHKRMKEREAKQGDYSIMLW